MKLFGKRTRIRINHMVITCTHLLAVVLDINIEGSVLSSNTVKSSFRIFSSPAVPWDAEGTVKGSEAIEVILLIQELQPDLV